MYLTYLYIYNKKLIYNINIDLIDINGTYNRIYHKNDYGKR